MIWHEGWHLTIDWVRFWDTKEVNGVSINSKYWIKKDDSGIILGINNINAYISKVMFLSRKY